MKARSSSAAPFSAEDMLLSATDRHASRATDAHPIDVHDASAALAKLVEATGHLDVRPSVSPVVLIGVLRLAEAGLLALCAVLALWAFDWRDGASAGLTVAAIAILSLLAWRALRLNALQVLRTPLTAFARMLPILAALTAAGAAALWWGGAGGALPVLATWWLAASTAVVSGRFLAQAWIAALTRDGRLERRAVVVGGGPAGAELLEMLALQSDPDLRIIGVFDDRNDARSPLILAGYPKLGTVSDLVTIARKTRIDLILFTLPITAEKRLIEMLKKLWVLPTDIRLAAHRSGLRFRPQSYSYVGGVPVLDMFDKPIADWDVVVKAVFDRVVGTLALVALLPVLLLTALAIKLDSKGPVFFKQMRHGFNNEPVEVYKFRSLFADKTDHAAARQVTKNDPRVTRVGRFIRKTSLDELPQLINVVFKGNLSLVGPRPHAVHAQLSNRGYDDVVDSYFARHRVKPGITGWAQVNGWRGETDTPVKIQKRVEHDLAYIENWSIFFDIYILAITPYALTRTENAY